jgi:5'-nucleotidase
VPTCAPLPNAVGGRFRFYGWSVGSRMRILIVNDDGAYAPGLDALCEAAYGLPGVADVLVVAPDREQSGASHAISIANPVRPRRTKHTHPLKPGEPAPRWAVNGTPVDCTLVGLFGLSETRPDLVLSGVNLGGNLGNDVLYSGTVQAAAEAAMHGIPAIAFSLAYRGGKYDFTFATKFASSFIEEAVRDGALFDPALKQLHGAPLLSVNIPYWPDRGDPTGFRIARLGRQLHGAEVISQRHDPYGQPYYWTTTAFTRFAPVPDTDCACIDQNLCSVTPLTLDMTRDSVFDRFMGLAPLGLKVSKA